MSGALTQPMTETAYETVCRLDDIEVERGVGIILEPRGANAPDTPDPHITFRSERDQSVPAESGGPVVLGASIPVGAQVRVP